MGTANRLPNFTDHDIMLLKVFDAVVKAGSFTGAEVCLNKSKSAISIHISSLESRLGQTLCRRGRSGFSLTPEGQQIYAICKDLFADLDRFRDRVSRVTSLYGGTLAMAVDDGLLGRPDAIAEAVANFKTACPDVFLNLYTTSPERVLTMMLENVVDIGICALTRDVPGAALHTLYSDELALYCSDEHPLYALKPGEVTDEMLAGAEFVDLASYQEVEIETFVEKMRPMARSGQAPARLLLILSGKMIGLLPRDFAADWVRRGRLKEIETDGLPIQQKCYAIVRRDVTANKVCGRMLLDLKRAFGATARSEVSSIHPLMPATESRAHDRSARSLKPAQLQTRAVREG